MHYFIIPSILAPFLAKVVLCHKKSEDGFWWYKQSLANIEQDVLVPDKARIFEVPDPLDQLILLSESKEIGLRGAIVHLVDGKIFNTIKSFPVER